MPQSPQNLIKICPGRHRAWFKTDWGRVKKPYIPWPTCHEACFAPALEAPPIIEPKFEPIDVASPAPESWWQRFIKFIKRTLQKIWKRKQS